MFSNPFNQMITKEQGGWRKALVWVVLAIVIIVPFSFAATSPLLAWRDPVYITACFAGVITLGLLLLQPLLIGGYVSGLSVLTARCIHRWIGALLVTAVVVHVVGLWISNPPDVIDVLLFNSPTPFSNWGVIAMWTLFVSALLAAFRRRLHLRPRNWSMVHSLFAIVIVIGTVVHAVLIEGTMEPISKAILCGLVLIASLKVIFGLRFWAEFGKWAKARR